MSIAVQTAGNVIFQDVWSVAWTALGWDQTVCRVRAYPQSTFSSSAVADVTCSKGTYKAMQATSSEYFYVSKKGKLQMQMGKNGNRYLSFSHNSRFTEEWTSDCT